MGQFEVWPDVILSPILESASVSFSHCRAGGRKVLLQLPDPESGRPFLLFFLAHLGTSVFCSQEAQLSQSPSWNCRRNVINLICVYVEEMKHVSGEECSGGLEKGLCL